jgi:hypothetical protein
MPARKDAASAELAPSDAAEPDEGEPGLFAQLDQLVEEVAPEPPPDDRPRMRRQWDHVVSASDGECVAALTATGAKFRALPEVAAPNARGCGIPRGVLLSRGPTGITYSPPISIDCSLALRLVEIEQIVQEEARTHLDGPIHRVATLGSYACRKVVGRLAGWSDGISEHSFGNAVDIARFDPKKGRGASVLKFYEPDADEPKTAEGRFLRSVQRRVRREAGVRVLGPNFDASHRDHLHIDAGSPRWH